MIFGTLKNMSSLKAVTIHFFFVSFNLVHSSISDNHCRLGEIEGNI